MWSSEICLQCRRQTEKFSRHRITCRFSAGCLVHRLRTAIVFYDCRPFGGERFWIVIRQCRFERLAIRKHSISLYQMKLGAVWRTITIDQGFVVEADCIDDECLALL